MNLRKSIVALAILSLSSASIQSVIHAEEQSNGIMQKMDQFTMFENQAYGVTVKLAKSKSIESVEAKIELVKDPTEIATLTKNLPNDLNNESFELLVVKLVNENNELLTDIPAEITIKSNQLKGDLDRVLFLTPDGEYRTLSHLMGKEEVTFSTNQIGNFALVFKKNEQRVQQERFEDIVTFATERPTSNVIEQVVALGNDKSTDTKHNLTDIVAIADKVVTQEVNKPVEKTPIASLDKPIEKPAEKPIEKPVEQPTEQPTVVTPPVVVKPTEPEKPTLPIGFFVSVADAETWAQPQLDGITKGSYQVYEAGKLSDGSAYYGVRFAQSSITQVGESVTEPEKPVFDLLGDDDQDGYSNGAEATLGSDPFDADSIPTEKGNGQFFTSKEQAEKYSQTYQNKVKIVERQDEQGRKYYDLVEVTTPVPTPDKNSTDEHTTPSDKHSENNVDTNNSYNTGNETNAGSSSDTVPSPETEENANTNTTPNPKADSKPTTEVSADPKAENNSTTESTANPTTNNTTPSETETPAEATNTNSDATPATTPLPDGMSETLRERHEAFLSNGFHYVGKEGDEHVYRREATSQPTTSITNSTVTNPSNSQ